MSLQTCPTYPHPFSQIQEKWPSLSLFRSLFRARGTVCMYVCTVHVDIKRTDCHGSKAVAGPFVFLFFFPLYVNANASSEWDHPSRFFPPPNFNMINIRSPCVFLPAVWQHASIASFNLVSAGSSRWSVSAVCPFHEAETTCVFDRVPQAWDVKPWRLSSGYQCPFQKSGFQFG